VRRSESNREEFPHAYVVHNDRATHVLVPVEDYEELVKAAMVQEAIAKLEDPNTEWIDFDDAKLQLAADRIAAARKAAGLTQKQLGEKLGLPQSQISRIERNQDRTTVRTLKRIARALKVDVRTLLP
jgi:DNA-binding XRE family transcriptional regulator